MPHPVNKLRLYRHDQVKQAGEIANFLVDEGQSVEYKQPLADMYPYFGGHIIGDKKHA